MPTELAQRSYAFVGYAAWVLASGTGIGATLLAQYTAALLSGLLS